MQRISRRVPRRRFLERMWPRRRETWRTSRAATSSPRSTTQTYSSACCIPRAHRGNRASSAEPDEDEQLLEDPERESPDESSLVGKGGHAQLSEDRRDSRGALGRRQGLEGHPEHGGHLGPRGRLDGLGGKRDIGDDEHLRLVAGCPGRHVTEDLGPTLQVDPDLLFRLPERGREHRRILVPMASAREADLPGPRIAFAFRPLAQEDVETSWTILKDGHHGRGRLRLQLRLRELEGEQELPQAFEGSFRHPSAAYALPEYNELRSRTRNVNTPAAPRR